MKFKNPDTTSKDMLMTEAPSWEPLSSVSELMEALMAWQTLDQIIHPSHYGTNVIVWIVKKVTHRPNTCSSNNVFTVTLSISGQAPIQESIEGARNSD